MIGGRLGRRTLQGTEKMSARLAATITLLAGVLMIVFIACESAPASPTPTPADPAPPAPDTRPDDGENKDALERAQAELDRRRALWEAKPRRRLLVRADAALLLPAAPGGARRDQGREGSGRVGDQRGVRQSAGAQRARALRDNRRPVPPDPGSHRPQGLPDYRQLRFRDRLPDGRQHRLRGQHGRRGVRLHHRQLLAGGGHGHGHGNDHLPGSGWPWGRTRPSRSSCWTCRCKTRLRSRWPR